MTALEHTLVILLLVVGLLNARPNIPKLTWWMAAGLLALALIVPATPIPLPWDWLSALIIPILFWQAAARLANTKLAVKRMDLAFWAGITLGIGGILYLTSELPPAGTLLFGLLAASMVWQATEKDGPYSPLGHIGPLALAFLLAEIAPAVEAPGRYAVALLAGAGIGAMLGYAAVHTARLTSNPFWRKAVSIGQSYAAYAIAIYLGLSGVAAALFSVAVYVIYGTQLGLWVKGSIDPRPFDSPPVFTLAMLSLAFFAWQTHVPVSLQLVLEIGLSLAFVALVILIARRSRGEIFAGPANQAILRVGALLAPSLLLWPREALLDPMPLALALLTAALVTIGAHYSLTPLLKIYEWMDDPYLDEGWIDQRGRRSIASGQLMNTLHVRQVMDRDYATITRTTPVAEIARLFHDLRLECLLVVDAESHLAGIVTHHDLFVKMKNVPRTDLTYMAVFNEPVDPEKLLQVYAEKGWSYTAADVMTEEVVWVKESATLGQAVRLMVTHGFKCLPVLDTSPAAGGKLVGLFTRSCIVRLLAQKRLAAVQMPQE